MKFSNQQLMDELNKLRADECGVLAKFIYFLAEAMKREIHLSEGYSSLFDFLVRKFGYSEGSAARRVAAVKVYKIFPDVLSGIQNGKVKLSNLHLISKHVTSENASELIKASIGKNKAEMESFIALKFFQSKPVPKRDCVKSIPSEPVATQPASFKFDDVESSEIHNLKQNFRVSVTLDQDTYEKLVRLQELSGKDKISDALDIALEFYLAKKDPEKIPQKPSKPRGDVKNSTAKKSRQYIPVPIRREVFRRDASQCVYTSPSGQRCTARRHLELDHVVPYSYGGPDTLENLQLLCSQHNKHRWKFRMSE